MNIEEFKWESYELGKYIKWDVKNLKYEKV